MKILHLLQSSRFSGAENVVCQIIKMSEQFDNAEMVYCSVDGQIKESLKERNITFVPISELSISEVKRVISEQKPDLIHAHDRSACITAALASGKIPVIAHMHVNNNKGFSLFLKNTIWTLFSRKYRHIFWVSDSAYEQFQFKKLLKSKSSVLYNVIDINELYKKVEEDKNTYDYDVVYVGRLSYQKNPERLMQVLQQVVRKKNNVKIAVVGDGAFSEYVSDFIIQNNLENNIYYLGYNNNPLKIIFNAKVMVMTSRFEGTPMVALEAQCLGVPVVSTPVDGMKTIIKNGYNGYLFEENVDLVDGVLNIVNDAELHNKMKTNSLKSSKEYNDVSNFYGAISKAYYLSEEKI